MAHPQDVSPPTLGDGAYPVDHLDHGGARLVAVRYVPSMVRGQPRLAILGGVLAAAMVGCGGTTVRTVTAAAPRTAPTTALAPAPTRSVLPKLEAAASREPSGGFNASKYRLSEPHVAGEWATATWSGPQPERLLFRRSGSQWHVAQYGSDLHEVPGLSASVGRTLGIEVLTAQQRQAQQERVVSEEARRRASEPQTCAHGVRISGTTCTFASAVTTAYLKEEGNHDESLELSIAGKAVTCALDTSADGHFGTVTCTDRDGGSVAFSEVAGGPGNEIGPPVNRQAESPGKQALCSSLYRQYQEGSQAAIQEYGQDGCQ